MILNIKHTRSLLLALLFLIFTPHVLAEAGRVVFVYGAVTAQGTDGIVRKLSKRDKVEAGEIVRTSSASIVQLRMIDKAFIALRSNSEVKIESYKLGANKDEDVGFFALLKGGFRAVTGIIGKRLRSSYKVRTVNATIGIRGTDYTARLCNKDCNQAFGNLSADGIIEDGLYVGVTTGGINLTNQLGTLDLDELQYGYVKDATTAPVALISAPEFLFFNSRPPSDDSDQASSDDESTTDTTVASRSVIEPVSADLNTDAIIKEELQIEQVEISQQQIEQNVIIDQVVETQGGETFSLTEGEITSSRMVVTSYGKEDTSGSIASVYSNPFEAAQVTNNELLEFENNYIDGGAGRYTQGTSSSINLGYDPDTGIAWGRWYAGDAQFESSTGSTNNIGLTNASLHWVTSPDQTQSIALPSSGSSSYTLIGNTNPTDNYGNTGVLGAATLNANFTNMTVDTTLDIGINNQVWNATGSAIPINTTGGFTGGLNVDVDSTYPGTGSAAGFFTNNAEGAGIGFALEADTGLPTTVNGTAIFKK
jgi:hypothetical protein